MAALPESKASQSGQSFAFMQLPLGKYSFIGWRLYTFSADRACTEIRTMIYEEMLVVPCRIPAVPGRVPAQIIDPKGLYGKDDLYPYTRILEVSKAIYAEANPVLYSLNKFKTLSAGFMEVLYDHRVAFELALQNEGVAAPERHERWVRELRRMTAATFDPNLGKIPKSFYTSCDVSSRLMPEALNPGEVTIRDTCSTDTICPWDRGEQAAFDLVVFLRSIGLVNAGHIRNLELILFECYQFRQMSYLTEVLRQHTPNLRGLTIREWLQLHVLSYLATGYRFHGSALGGAFKLTSVFKVYRNDRKRTAFDGPWDNQRHGSDALPLCLFGLGDMASHLRHLASLRFGGCIDEFDEIGMAIIKARPYVEYYPLGLVWKSLMEKYRSKVNGAGVACLCRRQTCFLKSPGGHGWQCEALLD